MNVATPILNTLALCAGVGMLDEGFSAGCEYLGFRARVLAYVERDSYAATTLLARMDEQSLEPAPVWCGDLERFPCGLVRGRVDCVVAGFPCQPWSAAGSQRGTEDDRWLWPAIARILRETESPLCFLENVPGLVSGGGLEHVLFSLAELGFDAEWVDPEAAEVGASHERRRIFILAVCQSRGRGILRQSSRRERQSDGRDSDVADAERLSRERRGDPGIVGSAAEEDRCDGHQRQRSRDAARDGREDVADTGCICRSRRSSEQGTDGDDARQRNEAADHDQRCDAVLADSAGDGGSSEREQARRAGSAPHDGVLADAIGARRERREQLSAFNTDGRTDGRAGTMPINFRTSS